MSDKESGGLDPRFADYYEEVKANAERVRQAESLIDAATKFAFEKRNQKGGAQKRTPN